VTWETRYVRVIVEGGHTAFFDRFLSAEAVTSLVLVSPWIAGAGEHRGQLELVARKIEHERIPTWLLTRHPSREPVNLSALQIVSTLATVRTYFNNELHAKVYVCRCAPFGFAYVGSANLTGRAMTAYEVGVMVDGKGEGERIVEELERIGTVDLLNRAGTYDASDLRRER
jgi:hypothetical protein